MQKQITDAPHAAPQPAYEAAVEIMEVLERRFAVPNGAGQALCALGLALAASVLSTPDPQAARKVADDAYETTLRLHAIHGDPPQPH